MIDWSRVTELRDEIGPDGFDEIVEIFLEEVDGVITRLRDTDAPGDLGADMHFLKGSALNLGFADFAALCETGEQACAAGNPNNVNRAELLACYDASRMIFMAELAQRLAA